MRLGSRSPPMPDPQPTDAHLVAAAQRDRRAFDALYRRYVTPVYRYVRARVGTAQDADDVTAAVFVEALDGLSAYTEQGRFPAWLFTIARRQVVAHMRRRRPDVGLEGARRVAAVPGPAVEDLDMVARGMAVLDDTSRDAVALRFFAGLPVLEVARILGKGESATKMLLHRALKRMRRELAEGDDG